MNQTQFYVILFAISLIAATAFAEPIGLTRTRPTSGRFVEAMGGYMVPYEVKIPGTEVTFRMMPIPGGEFWLGSPEDERGHDSNESPQVKVAVPPFWIGQHEVTWDEYLCYDDLRDAFRRFEDLGIRKVTKDNRGDVVTAPTAIYDPLGILPAVKDKRAEPKYPAVAMTQYGAKQYSKWLSKLTGDFYCLPSEVEWEYACRAGSKSAYYFGDDAKQLDEYAWHFGNSNETTHPVGGRKPNAWGLYDMHGNAAEWVLDQFDQRGYQSLIKRIEERLPPINWPRELHPRTVRGGSWDSDADKCRSASRLASTINWQEEDAQIPVSPWWLASSMQNQIGFRIARPLEAPQGKEQSNYWDADVKELRDAVETRIVQDGRGTMGLVDPKLPDAIRRARKE